LRHKMRLKGISSMIILVLLLFVVGCASLPRTEWPAPEKGIYHQVERGQTLWRIARTYGVSMQKIVEANGLADASKIEAGQRLFIPGATKVLKVQIYQPSLAESEALKGDFIWPVKGRIIQQFGMHQGIRHHGIDIAVPFGTSIVTSKSGTVVQSTDRMRGYGKVIIIEPPGRYSTVYAYNSINLVKEGQQVRQGQAIAKVGSSGRAEVSSLHFEIRRGHLAQNPLYYLP